MQVYEEMNKRIPHISYVVEQVVEFGPIPVADGRGEALSYRVEICRSTAKPRRYFPRIYRIETFRVQPTFPLKKRQPVYKPSDHAFAIRDDVIDIENLTSQSAQKLIRHVEEAMAQRLFSSSRRRK